MKKVKRKFVWAGVLLAVMLLFVGPVPQIKAENAYTLAVGACGPSAKWVVYSNGVMEIIGEGEVLDYAGGSHGAVLPAWYNYREKINRLIIDERITSIGEQAFGHATNDMEIGLQKLEYVEIPDSVAKLGRYAFYKCQDLKSITIGSGLKELGDYAFSYCPLENISVDSENTAFVAVDNILYSKDYTKLYKYPQTDKESCVIMEGVEVLEKDSMGNLANMKEVKLPQSLTHIEREAFSDCTQLKRIYYSGTKPQWKKIYIDELDNDAIINANITYLEKVDLKDCEIMLSQNIDDYLYSGSEKQPKIIIKNESYYLVENEDFVCEYHNNINEGTATVTILGIGAFEGKQIRQFDIIKRNAKLLNSGKCSEDSTVGWKYYDDSTLVIEGNGEMPDYTYNQKTPWYQYRAEIKKICIGNGITKIGKYAFAGCNVEFVSFGNDIKTIGEGEFLNNGGHLKCINLPVELTTIERSAFSQCGFKYVVIPDSVETIENYVFDQKMDTMCFGNGILELYPQVLRYGATNVFIKKSCKRIYDSAISAQNIFYEGSEQEWNKINKNEKDFISTKIYYNTVFPGQKQIADVKVFLEKEKYYYDNHEKIPNVTIYDNDVVLEEGNDYILTYMNNRNPGKGMVIVSGMGNYKGTVIKTFMIEKNPDLNTDEIDTPGESETQKISVSDQNNSIQVGNVIKRKKEEYLITSVNGVKTVEYKRTLKVQKNIVIPGTVNISGERYQVTSIAANCFKGQKKIKKIVIGKNVKYIGSNAFYGCKNLKTIRIDSKLLSEKTVGKDIFKKIYKKVSIKVPKSKLKKYKKIFKGKGLAKTVKIKS